MSGSYNVIELWSHAAYERLHRLLNLEHPRTGRCEWCGATGCRTGYAVAEPGRYSLNRADWLELCNRCHIHFGGPFRRRMAPRSQDEMEKLRARHRELVIQQWNAAQERRAGRVYIKPSRGGSCTAADL